MKTTFEELAAEERRRWKQENAHNFGGLNMQEEKLIEVTGAKTTPITDMTDRIKKVSSRISNAGQFVCETIDRLTGPRPQEVAGAGKEDTPMGEYYALGEALTRLEMVATYLEGEVDRLHTL